MCGVRFSSQRRKNDKLCASVRKKKLKLNSFLKIKIYDVTES